MKRKLLIAIPPKLLEHLDSLKTERECTRNRIIEEALWKYVRNQTITVRDDYRIVNGELPEAPPQWTYTRHEIPVVLDDNALQPRQPSIDPQVRSVVEELTTQRRIQRNILQDYDSNIVRVMRSDMEGASAVPESLLGQASTRELVERATERFREALSERQAGQQVPESIVMRVEPEAIRPPQNRTIDTRDYVRPAVVPLPIPEPRTESS